MRAEGDAAISANQYAQVGHCPLCGEPNPALSRCRACLSELLDGDFQQMAARVVATYPTLLQESRRRRRRAEKKNKMVVYGITGLLIGFAICFVGHYARVHAELSAVGAVKERAAVALGDKEIASIRAQAATTGIRTAETIVVAVGLAIALAGLAAALMGAALRSGHKLEAPPPSQQGTNQLAA